MNEAQRLAELKRQRAAEAASGNDDRVEELDREVAQAKVDAGNGRPAPIDQPGGIVQPPFPGDEPALDVSEPAAKPQGGTVTQDADNADVLHTGDVGVAEPTSPVHHANKNAGKASRGDKG